MVCGFLPVRLSFPTVASVLFGPTVSISDDIILDCFIDFLTTYESSIISEAVVKALKSSSFTPKLQGDLLGVFSRLGGVQTPTPANFRQLVISVARHQLIGKSLGQLYTQFSSVPIPYREFWQQFTVDRLFDCTRH